MTKTNSEETAVLDTFCAGTNLWVGLSSTTPTEAGANITEPSGNGYARVNTAGLWGTATAGDPSSVSNNATVSFPESTGAWLTGSNLTHMVIFSASTGGTARRFAALTTARSVNAAGITLSFASGALTLTED